MDRKELTRLLKQADCPFSVSYDTLEKENFSTMFKSKITSMAIPTIKQFVQDKEHFICISLDTKANFSDRYFGFGWIYVQCVAGYLFGGTLPVYKTRADVMNILKEKGFIEEETLFIDHITTEGSYYTDEDIQFFSDFLYKRYEGGLNTVLCIDGAIESTRCLSLFIRSFLKNKAKTIFLGG